MILGTETLRTTANCQKAWNKLTRADNTKIYICKDYSLLEGSLSDGILGACKDAPYKSNPVKKSSNERE